MKRHGLWLVAAWLTLAQSTLAQNPEAWVGRRVFMQPGTVWRAALDQAELGYGPDSSRIHGKLRDPSRTYRVERINGNWLRLKDEKSGVGGWVRSTEVTPVDPSEVAPNAPNELTNRAFQISGEGDSWASQGSWDQAIASYTEAIRLKPDYAEAYVARGRVRTRRQDFKAAAEDYNQALQINPYLASAYDARAALRIRDRDFEGALADYDEAIRIDPTSGLYLHNRGFARVRKQDYARAVADYDAAIAIESGNATWINDRAWVWATCPDAKVRNGKRAVETATVACDLTAWKDGNLIDTLAAAYAEVGDFARAVDLQKKANALLTNPTILRSGEHRLALYRARKPYREEN